MNDHEPDAFEKRVRFGCGFLFGAVVAFLLALREVGAFSSAFWAIVVAVAVIFGLLAVRYGDRFWHLIVVLLSRW